jgi:acyl-CoA synthetase (AMP-forming)/AMP-acid ligase II
MLHCEIGMKPYLTLHHPASAQRYYSERMWREDTFYSLLTSHATERPDAGALQDARQALTWGELKRWTDGVAADLREYGLVGGDRVMMWLSNRIEAVVMFLAFAREGIACNPSVHKTYRCAEVGDLLNTLSARVLLTEDGWGTDRATVDYGWFLSGDLGVMDAKGNLRFEGRLKELIIRGGRNIYPSHWLLSYLSRPCGQPTCVAHALLTVKNNDFGRVT